MNLLNIQHFVVRNLLVSIHVSLSMCLTSCADEKSNTTSVANPNSKESSLTLYLKNETGEILRLADIDVLIAKKSALEQIVAMRKLIKNDYAFPVVSEEMVNKLKGKGYAGAFIPDEIDKKDAMLEEFTTKFSVPVAELQSEWNMQQIQGLMDHGILRGDLKREWRESSSLPRHDLELLRDSQFAKVDGYAKKAIEQGEKALKLLSEGMVNRYRTNIEGKVKIQIAEDEALFACTVSRGAIIAFLFPSRKFTLPEVEATQRDAFFVQYLPDTLDGLHEALPSAHIFYKSVPIGEKFGLRVLLLSDEFFNAVKSVSD